MDFEIGNDYYNYLLSDCFDIYILFLFISER